MSVIVRPELLRWARERASLDPQQLARMVGTKERPAPIEEWERTGELPLKKLERFAQATHAPFGMLFLDRPPEEPLPIRDFRQAPGLQPRRPSLNLLQTIYNCQLRQTWLSQHLQSESEKALAFVASATTDDEPARVAADIRERLGIGTAERQANRTLAEAVLWMIGRLDEGGIVVQRNGVVGNHTRRKLDRDEFKGFAIADPWAPLIFINGNDWLASQMFTLVHECAHIWIGASGVPDGDWFGVPGDPMERWCNQVAAEVLMPAEEVRAEWRATEAPRENARRLRRHFHVSGLALLVRARTLDLINQRAFDEARNQENEEFAGVQADQGGAGGGDFYRTAKVRLGKRFIREVIASTLEGKTLFSEAFELLGTKKTSVFEGLKERYLTGGEA